MKLPAELDRQLDELAKSRNVSRSAVIREALELLARGTRQSVTAAAGALVGSLRGSRSLSTSREHLEGYGE